MISITVYLKPLSTFIGRVPPRSDTLFGALCWGYRLLFSEVSLKDRLDEFEEAFNSEKEVVPPFLLSSCFLFIQGQKEQKRVHYLPRPFGRRMEVVDESLRGLEGTLKGVRILKGLKRKINLSEEEFDAVIQGRKSDADFIKEIRKELERRDKLSFGKVEQGSPADILESPHNAINRLSGAVQEGRFFYHQELVIKPGNGIFFCLKCRDEDLLKDLKQVLYFLGDRGIGGESSMGKGQFKPEFKEGLPFTEPSEPANYAVTLSLTYPDAYIRSALKESYYELEKRQGKVESMYARAPHIWKDSILMLREGSTIPIQNAKRKWLGANPVVREGVSDLSGHTFNVRQYGLAFLVKTKHIV